MVSGDRRAQILSTAIELFGKNGYHKTTVSDIAQAANMAQGTVYLYFDSKRSIFSALVDKTLSLFHEIQQYGTSVDDFPTIAHLHEQLPKMYRHVLLLLAESRTLVHLMLTEVRGADPEIEQKLAVFYHDLVKEIADNVQRGMEKGLFRSDCNPTIVAHCLIGMIERFASVILNEEHVDLDMLANELARFLLDGIVNVDVYKESGMNIHGHDQKRTS